MCVCVRDGCGRGCNEFAGRVQNRHVRFSFTELEMAILEIVKKARDSCCRSGHSALQATRRMPLWALAFALATGKNTRLFAGPEEQDTILY